MSVPHSERDDIEFEAEITDAMVKAGAKELAAYVSQDVELLLREELAAAVYVAMRKASRNSS